MRVRCDSDDEIVPIISGRTKTEFTAASHLIDGMQLAQFTAACLPVSAT